MARVQTVGSDNDGYVSNTRSAKDSAVAGNFRSQPGGLGVIIREFDRRPAVGLGHFSDQDGGVEPILPVGVAAAKIIGQQRAPTGAETDAAAGRPFGLIRKIRRAMKFTRG